MPDTKFIKPEKQPSRLSLPKSGIERLYVIDAQIASGRYPNTKTLAKKCSIGMSKPYSISTISRDIEFLRDRLMAPIEYSHQKRGYHYTEKTFRLPAGFTGAEDLLALGMAKSILSLYEETPLYGASVKLLESLTAPLTSNEKRDLLDRRIMVPKIAAAKVNASVWEIIITALKENRIITFEYLRKGDKQYQKRRLRPYQLLFDSGIWYICGFAEERNGIRIFSLSRIKNPVLTKDGFTFPENFNYTNLTGGSYFGVFFGMEKYKFIIDCYGEAEFYATERQWADDQKIRKLKTAQLLSGVKPEAGVRMEFTSTQFDKVLHWVLSCGCNAVPRAPKALVVGWKWHVNKMRKMSL